MQTREMGSDPGEFVVIRAKNPTGAEQSQNAGVAGERNEHQRDAAVITQVRNGFDAAAEQIEIGDGVVV
ncbi:MAG: hypothetical protein QOF15_2854 [Mycobacterium sp.]|nr:hypothetical protein [Mycobacterium sp.]